MRPLSDLIPLRKTTVWGGFREAKLLPHRYGTTSGELFQYDQARKIFVWADHASEGIDEVLVNGLTAGGWSWRNDQDTTGRAVTIVEFLSPPADNDVLIARGRGKLHPRTGERMTNPAAVLWDLHANICGNPLAESELDRFRVECDTLGISVAGSIDDSKTIQSLSREICANIGAVFSPDCIGLARVYPGGYTGVSRETIDCRFELSCASQRASIVNSITISFAYESGEPTKSIQLEAPDSIAMYGRSEQSFESKWISSSRVAFDIAKRYLSAYARPKWVAKANGIKRSVRVGDTITASHPVLQYSGTATILSRTQKFSNGVSDIEFEAFIGQVPRVVITRQSEAFTANNYVGADVQSQGSERLLTLKEESGAPIVNAAVTLDGQTTRYTDASGRVSFPVAIMPVGTHTLTINTTDGRTLTTSVLVQ